jgi:predicted RNA-binding Zn ribbon-like protein
MTTADPAAAPQFGFLGGALPLDFCNTVDWHTSSDPHDRFGSHRDVLEWAKQAGTIAEGKYLELIQLLDDEEREGQQQEAFRRTVAIREAIFRIFASHARGVSPLQPDLEKLRNRWSEAIQLSRLEYVSGKYVFVWEGQDLYESQAVFERPIYPVIRAAVELLCSPELARVKICEGSPGCGWLFLDTTKNGSRRWCSMRDCGNREKTRRFYGKRKQSAMGETIP